MIVRLHSLPSCSCICCSFNSSAAWPLTHLTPLLFTAEKGKAQALAASFCFASSNSRWSFLTQNMDNMVEPHILTAWYSCQRWLKPATCLANWGTLLTKEDILDIGHLSPAGRGGSPIKLTTKVPHLSLQVWPLILSWNPQRLNGSPTWPYMLHAFIFAYNVREICKIIFFKSCKHDNSCVTWWDASAAAAVMISHGSLPFMSK